MRKLFESKVGPQGADSIRENICKLKSLFPEVVGEDGINVDVLNQLIGKELATTEEKYGLNWNGKREARHLSLTPSTGTLRPSQEQSVDWETTKNLMIEGDNLEVLKLLQKSYTGKVKLIYIDPPYNTGKDFIYPDNYQSSIRNYLEITGQIENGRKISSNTESSGRFHTDWLNMMYPRLKLARSLLKEDGAIFISISDEEKDNLRGMLNEIFGEDNFIECFVVRSNPRGNQARKLTASEHEYVLCYARNSEILEPLAAGLTAKQKAEYSSHDEEGEYRELGLRKRGAGSRREDAPNQYYPLYVNTRTGEISIEPKNEDDWVSVLPKLSDGTDGRWRWAKDTVASENHRLLARVVNSRDGQKRWDIFEKNYLSENTKRKIRSILYEKEFNYENATEEIKELFGRAVFDYAKPKELVAHFIKNMEMSSEDCVMDFFAGSGTTGHAVMNQNAADGVGRRYILVQLQEQLRADDARQKVACEFCVENLKPLRITELTKERLRRAAKVVKEENPMFSGDLGFRVYRLDTSNIREWEPDRQNLPSSLLESVDHLKTDRTETDILYELLLKLGLDLCVPIEARKIAGKDVHSIGGGVLLACLAEKITLDQVETLAEGILAWQKALGPAGDTTCVFRDSAFVDDVAKTNLTAILNQHGLANVRSL